MTKVAASSPVHTHPGLSAASIAARTQRAREIERIFTRIQPGQTLANASEYLDRVDLLMKRAVEDRSILYQSGTKVTPQIQKARKALDQHIQVLERVLKLAQANQIIPKLPGGTNGRKGMPWEGQLRAGETPLHWAVRNHEHRLALMIRLEMRQTKLIAFCQKFIQSAKDEKWKALLSKPESLMKLLQALEIINIVNPPELKGAALKKLIPDAETLKIIQHPNFSKLLHSPEIRSILNGIDVLADVDANRISPLEEAILQKDREMIHLMLFPHLVINPALRQIFWSRNQEIQTQIATMKQIDPEALSPTCRAAYLGDVEYLSTADDLDMPDARGLRPLHYAILASQTEAIELLLPQTKIYPRNEKEPSFLDYAILSGNAGAYELFKKRNSPFRLSHEAEEYRYLVASGILNQQLSFSARAKDPIGTGGSDQSMLGINVNALWSGLSLFNWATGLDHTSWAGWASTGVENLTFGINRHITGLSQTLNILPNWARTAYSIYANVQFGLFLLSPFLPALSPHAQTAAQWLGIDLQTHTDKILTGLKWATNGYTALRLAGAVQPVIKRLGAYKDAFASRPKAVMKRLATDAFNIGTQSLMSYQAWKP